jgi:hypothetical protein
MCTFVRHDELRRAVTSFVFRMAAKNIFCIIDVINEILCRHITWRVSLICLHTFFYRQPQYNIQSSRHSTSLHVAARHATRKFIYKCYTSCNVTTKNSFIISVILHIFFAAIWKYKPVTARRSSSCCMNIHIHVLSQFMWRQNFQSLHL